MTVRHRVVPVLFLLVSVGVGCDRQPTEPVPSAQEGLADSLVLAPGDEVDVGLLRLAFQAVSSDSRCPVDAVCIWQGNAAIEITVSLGDGPGHPETLDTSDGTPSVDFDGFRITLLAVLPLPHAGVAIPQGDYRAAFRVEEI